MREMDMTVDKYVELVRDNVWGKSSDVERLEADLRARFELGTEKGESTGEVARSLGTPEEVAAAFMEEAELTYAGFFERVFAFVGDGGICATLGLPFALVGVLVGPRLEALQGGVAFYLALAALIGLFAGYVGLLVSYFPVLEHRFGQTAGKRVMGIHVRSEDGSSIGLGAAILRRLSLYFEVFVLDALFVPFTQKRQRALDVVAKTVVLRDEQARGVKRYVLCLAMWLPILLAVGVLALVFPA